jgi:hypothetical protein
MKSNSFWRYAMKKIFVLAITFLTLVKVFGQENVLFSNSGSITFQNNDCMIIIILVNDLNAALDVWNVPNVTPNIKQTTSVKINEPISLFIVYASDKDEIDLTYNLKILKPNGDFSSEENYNGLKISDTVINKRILYKANQLPTLVFDENEEKGNYIFVVEVYDANVLLKTLLLTFNLE